MNKQTKTESEINAVKIVKNKLWTFGYRVKDYSNLDAVNFDLLVDEDIRVVVGITRINVLPKDCSVYAVVNSLGLVEFMAKPPVQLKDKLVKLKSPYRVFGRPKYKK